jgi:hypothetical protein
MRRRKLRALPPLYLPTRFRALALFGRRPPQAQAYVFNVFGWLAEAARG